MVLRVTLWAGVLLAAWLAGALFGGEPPVTLLSCEFEKDPMRLGWWRGARAGQKTDCRWTDSTSASGRHGLVAGVGWWASPRFEVKPFAYYRLRFSATVEGKGYWAVQYYDGSGQPLDADHYSGVYPSEEWRQHEFCFRGRTGASTAEVRFEAIAAELYIDDVRVEPISRAAVAEWADRVYAAIPPLALHKPPRAGPLLKNTLKKLSAGERVRIVLLGDSIMNDMGNSAFDVLIERVYPGSRVELIHSVRGGTGCPYYKNKGRVKTYVLDHKPDLLIIGGISNGHDPESIRAVIRQVRAKLEADILVLSGAVSMPPDLSKLFLRLPAKEREARIQRIKDYRPGLAKMTREEKVAYLDLRPLWDAYAKRIRKNPLWLRRDVVHANARGRQVLARILEAYFTPRR